MTETNQELTTETEMTESITKDYSTLTKEIDDVLKTLLDSVRTVKNIKKELDKTHLKELKNVKKRKRVIIH